MSKANSTYLNDIRLINVYKLGRNNQMANTVCALYLHNEVQFKVIIIYMQTCWIFLFLRNKEKGVCFHFDLLFYSSELFLILNRI